MRHLPLFRILLSLCLGLIPLGLAAQDLMIQVNLLPPYPVEADHYLENPDNLMVSLINQSASAQALYVGARLSSQAGPAISTRPGYKPLDPLELAPFETRVLMGSELEELGWSFSFPDDFEVAGLTQAEQDALMLSRTLPEGTYTFCLTAYDWDSDEEILETCGLEFDIQYATPPVIISPEPDDKSELITLTDPNVPLLIQWLPVYASQGLAATEVEYGLQIAEMDSAYREFGDAFVNMQFVARLNIVYEEEGLSGLLHSVDLQEWESLDPDKLYAVRIVAEGVDDEMTIQNDGVSNLVYLRYLPEEETQTSRQKGYVEIESNAPFLELSSERSYLFVSWQAFVEEDYRDSLSYYWSVYRLPDDPQYEAENLVDWNFEDAQTYTTDEAFTLEQVLYHANQEEDYGYFLFDSLPGSGNYFIVVGAKAYDWEGNPAEFDPWPILPFTYEEHPINAYVQVVAPTEDTLLVTSEDRPLSLQWEAVVPESFQDSMNYGLAVIRLPLDEDFSLGKVSDMGFDDYQLQAFPLYGNAEFILEELGLSDPIVTFDPSQLAITGNYAFIFAARASNEEGEYAKFDQWPMLPFHYDATNAAFAFIYPPEDYLSIQHDTSELYFRWNAELPFGYEDSVAYRYVVVKVDESLGNAQALSRFMEAGSLVDSLGFDRYETMMTSSLQLEREAYLPTDSLNGAGTYLIAVKYQKLAEEHTAIQFDEHIIFKPFDYHPSGAFLEITHPLESAPVATIAEDSLVVEWAYSVPAAYEHEVSHSVVVFELPDLPGLSPADVQHLSYDSLQSLIFSVGGQEANFVWSTSGLGGPRFALDLDSLADKGNYFLCPAVSASNAEGEQIRFPHYPILAFSYENASLQITHPTESAPVATIAEDSLVVEWAYSVPAAYEHAVSHSVVVFELPDLPGLSPADVQHLSYDSLQSLIFSVGGQEANFVWSTSGLGEPRFALDLDSLADKGNYFLCPAVSASNAEGEQIRFPHYPILAFSYTDSVPPSACQQDCYYTDAISELKAGDALAFNQLQIGHFTLSNLNELTNSGGLLSGKGEVQLDFLSNLRLKVSFENVSVNREGRIYDGIVKAEVETLPVSMTELNAALEQMDEMIDSEVAGQLHDLLAGQRLLSALGGANAVNLPVGLQKGVKGYEFFLGLTSLTLEPDQARANVAASIHLPTLGDDNYIALGASDICLTPGGFGSEFLLHMAQDLEIQSQGEVAFTLKGKAGSGETIEEAATYLAVDCAGIKGFALRGSVALPQGAVVPEDSEGDIQSDSSVIAQFEFQIERGGVGDSLTTAPEGMHFIAALDIEPFQVKGLTGWGFEMDESWLDLSDLANPDSLNFPEGYPVASSDKTWTGFYLRKGYLRTPKAFLGGHSRQSVGVQDLIIDPTVSLKLNHTGLIGIDEGNVDGWGFSLDTLQLSIQQNAFDGGGMMGRINLPVMDSTETLSYRALLSMAEESGVEYDFAIQPKDTLSLPMWVAQAQLNDNSYVKLHVERDSSYFDAFLKGRLEIDVEKFGRNQAAKEAPATVKLPGTDFEFGYHSREGFEVPALGFAMLSEEEGDPEATNESGSENTQPQLSGFPISLKEVDLEAEGENVSLILTPQLVLMGDEEGFAASTTFRITAGLEEEGERKRVKLQRVGVDAIELEVDVANILLEGQVEFYREDNDEGGKDKGTRGKLNVLVPGIEVGVNLAADFGTRITDETAAYGTEDYFGYWYVDGLFFSGTTGIPMSWVTLHGLGGGISVNMRRTNTSPISADAIRAMQEVDPNELTGDPEEAEIKRSNVEREPHFGARSLSFTTIMAIVRQELVNMDLGMEVAWQKGQGIQSVSLMGDGYFFTPINDRSNPQLRASQVMMVSLLGEGEMAVDLDLDAYMDFGIIKGGYEDGLMVQNAGGHYQNYGGANGKGYWDLNLGTYETPGKVEFVLEDYLDGAEAGGQIYFMAGHNVPTELPPLPEEIEQLLSGGTTSSDQGSFSGDAIEQEENRSSESLAAMQSGMGMALGEKVYVNLDLDAGLIYGAFDLTIGADLNLTQDQDRVCYASNNSSITPGVNGWYASGQAYAGMSGEIGVKARLFGDEQKLPIMELGAAVGLQGGLPNPAWFEGRAAITYSVLGGTLEGSSRFAINIGEQCQDAMDTDLADITFIGEVAPEGREVNPYSDVATSFNLPMEEVIYLSYFDEAGQEQVDQYRPYLHSFSVTEAGVGSLEPREERWNHDHTLVKLRFADPFTPKVRGEEAPSFTTEVVVRAEKWNPDLQVWEDLYDGGSIWEERKTQAFKTGEHPRTFDEEYVLYSTPQSKQRYFLQGELPQLSTTDPLRVSDKGTSSSAGTGTLAFKQNMAGFFPESDERGTYEYLLRFRASGEEDQDVALSDLAGRSTVTALSFELPQLQNETLYAIQVVRRNTADDNLPSGMIAQVAKIRENMDALNDTYDQYTVLSRAISAEQLSETVAPNEELLYVWYFRTSAYDLLKDKLAGAELSQLYQSWLYLNVDEAFDAYDVVGASDGDGDPIEPIVAIIDPFTHSYHEQQIGSYLQDPLLAYETQMESDPQVAGITRYSSHPYLWLPEDELNLSYESDMELPLNEYLLGGVDEPLRNAEIQREFSALFQTFAGGEALADLWSPSLPVSGLSTEHTSTALLLSLETHALAEEDAETLEDWASRALGRYFLAGGSMDYHYESYFQTRYPAFLDWYDGLLNRGSDLTDFAGIAGGNIQGTTNGDLTRSQTTKGKGGSTASESYELRFQITPASGLRYSPTNGVVLEVELE